MKIKLIQDLPVEAIHGCRKGRVFEVVRLGVGRESPRWFVMGDAGEVVGVLGYEAEEIEPTK